MVQKKYTDRSIKALFEGIEKKDSDKMNATY